MIRRTAVADKIKTLPQLAAKTKLLKSRGETIVMCHGVFDLLHPGHIRHFEAAKKHGTILVVTITADKYVNCGDHYGGQIRQ
ncbi:MAG: adenylyltransferase/cytidyltransferase family protein [Elusimicrobia bacterium]|nr:adenylyltransferase/cytidyltransferase family protein [Elusimicrobiota bacterium]